MASSNGTSPSVNHPAVPHVDTTILREVLSNKAIEGLPAISWTAAPVYLARDLDPVWVAQ
jgi:hypothetical protein